MEKIISSNQQTMVDEINKVVALNDRVAKRRKEYLEAKPHICAERSHFATESWKETEGEPLDIRRAKLFKNILDGISVVIRDGELIVGSMTKYIRGASPTVEFDSDMTFDIFKGDKISLTGLVESAGLSEEDKASLLKDANYWKGRAAVDSIRKVTHEVFGDYIEDLSESRVFRGPTTAQLGGQVIGHEVVIKKGINGIIADAKDKLERQKKGDFSDQDAVNKMYFWQAVIIACEGVIHFAHRYAELARELAVKESDETRKKELEKIANICQWVPANPARTFHEAVQSFWFIHLCAVLENNKGSECSGRMDQYLYPLYKEDLETGRLTRQEAAELLGLLRVKLSERETSRGKVRRESDQTNSSQLMTIGGVNSDGKDATNELTYLLLEVTRQVKTVQPPVYLRCHEGTPPELWMKAAEVLRDRGDGVPAFVSDRAVYLNFANMGISEDAARDYAVTGCVHPRMNYYSAGGGADVSIGISKVLELTLNNGVDPRTGKLLGIATGDLRNFTSFDQLYEAYKRQFSYFVDLFGKYMRLYWQTRSLYYSFPFISATLGDCIEKGLDLTRGGCRYQQLYSSFQDRGGFQNMVDSLVAIKKLVFEEKKLTMDRLLEALKANFEGSENEEIQRMLLAAPKYGNDDDYVDDIFNDLSLWQGRKIAEEKNPFGLNCRLNRGGATTHVYFGKRVGATPDGRKAWTPLADGNLSPMRGADRKGPTAVINSASKVNHTEVSGSALFNMKFTPKLMRTKDGLQKFISLVKTFQDRGGYFIQFNVQGNETLLEAKKHPEQYRDLLVRVAGYSAYFVDLSPETQDEIINRSEHSM